MDVSFDPDKRAWTLADRRFDFANAPLLLEGATLTLVDDRSPTPPEPRYRTCSRLRDRLVLIVWTPTATNIR